jgi:hypothetical protein
MITIQLASRKFYTFYVYFALLQIIKCIRLLFKLGASPNYIPDPKDFKVMSTYALCCGLLTMFRPLAHQHQYMYSCWGSDYPAQQLIHEGLVAHQHFVFYLLIFQADRLSPSEESLMPFMALEVAAILGDLDLASLLLECGASASICFAVHLAALKGIFHLSLCVCASSVCLCHRVMISLLLIAIGCP